MTCVIRIVCMATGVPGPEDGKYIKDYVPDLDRLGRGNVVCTSDKSQAKQFADAAEALAFWKHQSKRRPLRDDGRPNRPLTAFTVESEKV